MNDRSTMPLLSPKGARIRSKDSESRGSCFVVMAYNNAVLDSYYDEAIKPTVETLGYNCVRVDRQPYSDKIGDQIRNGIDASVVVIVDLTDDRPNCYFEAGYAVARDKVIIFQRLSAPPKYEAVFHFDVHEYPFYFTNKGKMMPPLDSEGIDLSHAMIEELDEAARKLRISRQALIKQFIRRGLIEQNLSHKQRRVG